MQRLMAALASRGLGASRPREALALLNHALGSERLLVEGRLQEYCTCLTAVLSACSSLQPDLASSLLLYFNMAGLCAAMMQAKPAASEQVHLHHNATSSNLSGCHGLHDELAGCLRWQCKCLCFFSEALGANLQAPLHVASIASLCLSCWCDSLNKRGIHLQALLRGSRGSTGPSEAARLLLDFSLKTSAVPGGTAAAIQLLQGIAAAGGLAAYLNACLAVVLAAESAEAKAEGTAWLTSLQLDEVSLPALTEAIVQVLGNTTMSGSCIHEGTVTSGA